MKSEEILTCLILVAIGYFIAQLFSRCAGNMNLIEGLCVVNKKWRDEELCDLSPDPSGRGMTGRCGPRGRARGQEPGRRERSVGEVHQDCWHARVTSSSPNPHEGWVDITSARSPRNDADCREAAGYYDGMDNEGKPIPLCVWENPQLTVTDRIPTCGNWDLKPDSAEGKKFKCPRPEVYIGNNDDTPCADGNPHDPENMDKPCSEEEARAACCWDPRKGPYTGVWSPGPYTKYHTPEPCPPGVPCN